MSHEVVVLPLKAGQYSGQRAIGANGQVDETGSLKEASRSSAADNWRSGLCCGKAAADQLCYSCFDPRAEGFLTANYQTAFLKTRSRRRGEDRTNCATQKAG
jgi:hypothetical protein